MKHGPPQSHGPILGPDVFGDGVKGAEGGNPNPLQVEEKGRAEGLWDGWRKSRRGSKVGTELRSPLPLFRGTSHGIANDFGRGLHGPLLPLASQMQHSRRGRSSLMGSRGFQRAGSAVRHGSAQHK